jgi:SNF2 family DNA or RNA helicase
MAKEFILAVRENTLLGYLITPYLINSSEKEYYKVVSNIIKDDIDKSPDNFTDTQKRIVKLIDEYSDTNLVKAFSRDKKKSVSEFYASLETDLIESRIRPYIDRRNVQIIDIAKENNIRIFNKADRYENVYNEDEIIIENQPAEAVFNFIRKETETRYFLSILHNNTEINLNNKTGIILSIEPCRILLNNSLYYFKDIDAKKLQPFFTKEYIPVHKRAEKKYFETFVLNSIKNFRVKATGFVIKKANPEKTAVLSLEKDWKDEFSLILKFKYNNIEFLANSKNQIIVKFEDIDDEFIFTKLERDFIWENNIKNILNQFDLIVENETNFKVNYNSPIPNFQHHATINWLNENSDEIEKQGIQIIQSFTYIKYFTGSINLEFKVDTKKDWFDIFAVVTFGDYQLPFINLKEHLKKGEREFVLPDGKIAVIPEEWFARYNTLLIMSEGKKENLRLKKYHFSLIEDAGFKDFGKSNIKNLLETFSNITAIENSVPQNINATLREYQKTGFAWLLALQQNNFGGCLADDMGLGKTLQTITLLAKTKTDNQLIVNNNKSDNNNHLFNSWINLSEVKSSLIVMPKSLIHNWYNEIKKFAPQLTVIEYTGTDRKELEHKISEFDIVLTSYGVARNDCEFLSKINFCYIILDESQYIKNPDSKIYKALLEFNSTYKLVLTGTPIENSLQDLWAQLNFVNHGLLGSQNFFRENFIVEIEKNRNFEIQEKLKKIISPFILRRSKQEVAKDLPQLTEQIIYCEMSDEQKTLYEEEKSKIRNKLIELIDNQQVKKSSIWIIKAMSILRQLANHPKMIGENNKQSGKFDEVISKIETLISENHKVLIFSSFVKHLNIFQEYFLEQKIDFSILTGASVKREAIINEFQNNKNINVFLISIKAGGVGLNLTSADYVFILDPWWNPAVENQAISRAHRIGQDKKVMVYRFISKDSIEEKIRKLQESKSELANIFLNSNNPLHAMSEENILDFFV